MLHFANRYLSKLFLYALIPSGWPTLRRTRRSGRHRFRTGSLSASVFAGTRKILLLSCLKLHRAAPMQHWLSLPSTWCTSPHHTTPNCS
ncbi:hypothetical protein JG687_00002854 [Phytophthora cactorum]|uniref:Uncharacterized protein n=1 Tax=Phytophthora cactorum TaxID=29920 RepID=A0A8T1UVS6_9STRA|nr:hypothetical protein JG687_00002854 [Phytophthora cactorum]